MNTLKSTKLLRERIKKVSYLTGGGGGIPAQCIAGNIYERSIIIILVTGATILSFFARELKRKKIFQKRPAALKTMFENPCRAKKSLNLGAKHK